MPLYEYQCRKCKKLTEKIEKMTGPHLKKCPHCGGAVERMASAPAIQFKGAGWYVTDYGGKTASRTEGAKAEQGTKGDSAAAGEAKSKESTAKEKPAAEKKPAKKK